MRWIERFKARYRLIINHSAELNRRVEIENILFKMSVSKRPLPDHNECRKLALKLGTPKKYWRKDWL